jgi:hypothetical protein
MMSDQDDDHKEVNPSNGTPTTRRPNSQAATLRATYLPKRRDAIHRFGKLRVVPLANSQARHPVQLSVRLAGMGWVMEWVSWPGPGWRMRRSRLEESFPSESPSRVIEYHLITSGMRWLSGSSRIDLQVTCGDRMPSRCRR